MTALQAARIDIHDAVRDEIRRLSVAHIRITLAVALDNWAYLFAQGRYGEARAYWFQVVEPLR